MSSGIRIFIGANLLTKLNAQLQFQSHEIRLTNIKTVSPLALCLKVLRTSRNFILFIVYPVENASRSILSSPAGRGPTLK